MTTHIRVLDPQLDATALLQRLLAFFLVAALVLGAAWLALSPTAVSEANGAVTRKWTELSADGAPLSYWLQVGAGRQARACFIAAYQTQLVVEWEALQPGDVTAMTCYGQSTVSLSRAP